MPTTLEVKTPRLITALPGPKAQQVIASDARFLSPSLTREYPLVAKKGHGAIIEDADGNSFLDFACGFGRFTRFLIKELDPGKVTVSDIDTSAVDFCRKTFRVKGFYSVDNPDKLSNFNTYNLIYVASLFSHLSFPLWYSWYEKLYNMLDEEGILIFSTHGMYSFSLLDQNIRNRSEAINDGFYYFPQSETKRISSKEYGTTYVNYDFVEKIVIQHNLGKIIAFYPNKLWNFQDVYVIKKENKKKDNE